MNSASNDLADESRLFVADNAASQIVIYAADAQNPHPIGRISSGVHSPYNLAVDQYGTLYVQNGNNTITEYNKGQKIVSKTLSEPGRYTATALTVGNDGTVYAGSSGLGKVFEFAAGSTKPTETLDCCRSYFMSLALDSKNDLFVSWNDDLQCCDGVERFKPGRKVGKSILGDVGAGAIAFDLHDNLLVGEGNNIAIYKPDGKTPFRKIHIGGWGDDGQLAFDSDETYLYLPSCRVPGCGRGEVNVYDYKTGKLAWTLWKGLRGGAYGNGVALWPAAPQ